MGKASIVVHLISKESCGFEWIRGGWVILVHDLGVSRCQSHCHHHNGEWDPLSLGAKTHKGGGRTDIWMRKDRKRQKRLLKMLTKLKGLRHQVTLSHCHSQSCTFLWVASGWGFALLQNCFKDEYFLGRERHCKRMQFVDCFQLSACFLMMYFLPSMVECVCSVWV